MKWEVITGISTCVVALCALIFTIWQANQIRKHNRISVTPHITTWTHTDSEKNLLIVEVMNNGIGPAMINSVSLFVDGEQITGEDTEPIKIGLKQLFPNS